MKTTRSEPGTPSLAGGRRRFVASIMSRASRRKKRRRKAARDKAKNLRRLIAKTENQLVNGDGLDWLRVQQDIIEAFQGQIAQRDIVLPQAALMDDMGLHTTTATTVNVDGVQMTPKQAAEYHRHHRGRSYAGAALQSIPPPVASGMPYAA